jgi:hypothetical protein
MPSIVWGRDPQEAFANPYEYGAQTQFQREASTLLGDLRSRLVRSTLVYHKDDRSLEKATWMLANDLVDSLIEGLELLQEKRHRIAARLFRDCVETIDLLSVLHSGAEAENALSRWFENQTIPHRDSRRHIESTEGLESALQRRRFYDQLSKFTHRTYLSLCDSYSLGRGGFLVPDNYFESKMLVQPQTVAAYPAVVASLIVESIKSLTASRALPAPEILDAWQVALETETVPRRSARLRR